MSEPDFKDMQADFTHLILSIASTALLKMGLDPESNDEKNMDIARYNIDLLGVLQEKTKKNLTEKEEQFLQDCIKDLKVKFIQADKK